MARLWQTALLSEWNPVFRYLPLESQIKAFQEEYYDAIEAGHRAGNSDTFVTFMLKMIDRTLDQTLKDLTEKDRRLPMTVQRLLAVMEADTPYTAEELLTALGLKSREALRKNYLKPALDAGIIEMEYPDKPTSRNQRYIRR